MNMSLHLNLTHGMWRWTIIADGVAFQGSSESYRTQGEAQRGGREALARYRAILASYSA